jgi:hypothetical protein
MRGPTSLEIQRYQCLLVRSEGRWVSLHLYSFFLFTYVIFMSFLIYIIFCMPDYLMGERLLYADVGPMRPADYARNRCRPRLEAAVVAVGGVAVVGNLLAGEFERVLRQIEWNFVALTRTVLMVEIEDLPPYMQTHVVGACNDPKPLCKDHHCFGVFLKPFPGCGISSNTLSIYLLDVFISVYAANNRKR